MKTQNANRWKWMRRVSSLAIVLMLLISFSGQASARILFQDDDFQDIDSEGILLNADDGGDEDVTLQFGNDGQDGTITFDDGTGDIILSTFGGDFDFSDDNITTTGNVSATDISISGIINFSGASQFQLPQGVANPGTCTEGDMFYNTSDNTVYVCTAANTWTAQSSGNQDFESVFSADGDKTLTTTNAAFTINTGTNDFIVTSNDWSVDANGNIIANQFSDGTATLTGGGLSGLTSIDGTTEGTIEAQVFDADAKNILGVWTVADDTAFRFGTDGDVLIQYDEFTDNRLEFTGINANVYIEDSLTVQTNATIEGTLDANGPVTIGDNGDTVAIDSSDWDISATGNMTGIGAITADGLFTGTGGATVSGANISLNASSNFAVNLATGSSTGAVSIGGGSNTVAIDSSSWDISSAGLVTGITGITSTGTVDLSGVSRLALHQGAANPGTCNEGDIFYNTTDNNTYICTAANIWTALSSSAQDFEGIYGIDADKVLTASSTFAIDAVGAVGIDSDAAVTIGGAGVSVTSDGGALAITGDGASDIDISNAGAAIDIDSATIAIDTTSTMAINTSTWDISGTGAASGFTTINTSGDITTSGGDFIIGTTGLSETTGATDSGAYLVGVFDEFDNTNATNVQDALDDLDALIGSNSANVDSMTFKAEYPNTIVFEDGTNNKGRLESAYDNTNREHFYRWSTRRNTDQDIDLRFRYELPADFVDAGNLTLRLRNDTSTAGDNTVRVIVRNDTDNTTCHDDGVVTAAAPNAWETVTITGAELDIGCSAGALLAAGDVIEVQIKMMADNISSGGTDVGTLAFVYTN